ncbi:hypothetical protein K4F52_000907 [Lecanicillium sp. MT-2017a]|nr:hypothetical protein K4F52_000907 [Lecanicillium sp. MT-2017a]
MALQPNDEGQRLSETEPLLQESIEDSHGAEADASQDIASSEERTIDIEEMPSTRLAFTMTIAWFGVFLGAADSTSIATLAGPIASEFQSLDLISWIATAYFITMAAAQPIAGRLTDIFGRGPGLAFSNLAFATGNLICGLAKSPGILILGRAIAGIGDGGLMSIPAFLATDLVPLRQRGFVGGIASLWYGAGAMLGGVVGGLLQDRTALGWRLAFLVQVPLAMLSALLVYFGIKVPPKKSGKSYVARIDFVGAILSCLFLFLFVLALDTGTSLVHWTSELRAATLSVSLAAFVAFIYWESSTSQPIIDVKLIRDRTVYGHSSASTGAKVMPGAVGTALGALGSGYLMKKTGACVRLVIAGTVVLLLGTTLLSFQDASSSPYLTSAAYFITGAGYNSLFVTSHVACIAAVDQQYQAVVTSAIYLARSLGGTAGIAVASAVYRGVLKSGLWSRFGDDPDASEVIKRVLDDLGHMNDVPKGWYGGVVASYMEAFYWVWLIMAGWSLLALISTFFMKEQKLHTTLRRE